MRLQTAFKLGRVSNLPTVTSNVLAGVALASAFPSPVTIALICIAMSSMYVAGMFLNDAFDREIDRVERPERPIPSGEVSAAAVFDAGFGMLFLGIAIVTGVAVATGAGFKPVVSSVALASLIIFYDANHKANPWSPVIMGLCRAAVYTTAALAVSHQLPDQVLKGCGLLLSYLIGLTFIAKQENLTELTNLWPAVFLAPPFVVVRPTTPTGSIIYIGFLLWTALCVYNVFKRQIKAGVTGLIAGISLLDALLISSLWRPDLAMVAVAAFMLTTLLQKIVPGT